MMSGGSVMTSKRARGPALHLSLIVAIALAAAACGSHSSPHAGFVMHTARRPAQHGALDRTIGSTVHATVRHVSKVGVAGAIGRAAAVARPDLITFVDSLCPSVNPDCPGGTIGVMRVDGTHLKLLPIVGRAPALSPDGKHIAFDQRSPNCATVCSDLSVASGVGTNPTRLVRDGRAPVWSRDGSLIAFEREISPCVDRSTCSEIWVVRSDGSSPHLLVRNARTPSWSPDGSRIAFVRGHQGSVACTSELWVARSNGSSARPLTSSGVQVLHAAWSPDGTRFALARHDNTLCPRGDRSEYGLYVLRSDGSSIRKIGGRADHVSWSSDGQRIAFERLNCTKTYCPPADVVLFTADGSEITPLRNTSAWPSFAPRQRSTLG
jgi:Tol biopolymer transport system component